ncbi:M48 family metalloprotease [Chloroflexota bacterium]
MRLLKPIKAGLRSKLFICIATILAGYSYCYVDDPLFRLLSILALFVLSEAMVLLWAPFFLGNFFESLKMTFRKNKSISWVSIPTFEELANKMELKLHTKKPFGLQENMNNAYTIPLTRQIIFGNRLMQKLSDSERLALASHEFTHLKQDHSTKMVLWIMFVFLLVSISLSFATTPAIVKNLIYAAAFLITFVYVSHHNEYAADAGAAVIAGKESTISLLQSLTPPEQWNHESETHPTIFDRVSKLHKM